MNYQERVTWRTPVEEAISEASRVLAHLQAVSGKHFSPTDPRNYEPIQRWMDSGYREKHFNVVIDFDCAKLREVGDYSAMRPAYLFSDEFENVYNDATDQIAKFKQEQAEKRKFELTARQAQAEDFCFAIARGELTPTPEQYAVCLAWGPASPIKKPMRPELLREMVDWMHSHYPGTDFYANKFPSYVLGFYMPQESQEVNS